MSSTRKQISRRQFLSRSSKSAAGVIAASSFVPYAVALTPRSRVIGANERINVAVVGIHNRGGRHVDAYTKIPNVRIKTICDIDENLFDEESKRVDKLQGSVPSTEYDYRRVLDDKNIDAVSIATTDHWHALGTIWACQAGKHVYVEKPVSHNIFECGKMIEAARKYNRIVAVGLQQRSNSRTRQAMKFLHDGGIGKIYMARVICLKPRESIERYPDGPSSESHEGHPLFGYPVAGKVPPFDSSYLKNVHYDMWLGGAPKRPFNRNRFHYNWHWNWDYGSGDIGNTSPHSFDVAVWGMQKKEHPVEISSKGGYFAFDSDQQTPNIQTTAFKYADGTILESEVRGLYTNSEQDTQIGNFFYGTKGWMVVSGGWKTFFGRENEPGPSSATAERVDPTDLAGAVGSNHFDNFIQVLRSGNQDDLACNIETGCLSTVLPHLANISYRLGRDVTYNGTKERFVGDKEADRMLTRKYRKPYVVPSKV